MEDKKIEDYLEIILITYNRSVFLDNTLAALLKSPFITCNITVLNNHSTDNTLEICNKYLGKFFAFKIITNKINIGGNANILRAVEISSGKYTWILADDDEYDFSDCNDLLDIIFSDKVDLIHVGAHIDVPWSFGGSLDVPRNLLKKGYSFFRFSSFIPCNIFKTTSFYQYIIDGYKNIINMYPHMPFLISYYTKNKQLYISKKQIVRGASLSKENNYLIEDMVVGLINTSEYLPERKDKIIFLNDFIYIDKGNKYLIPTFFLKILYNYNGYSFDYIKRIFGIYGIKKILISCIVSIQYFINKQIRGRSKSF
jgi:glycosyltransferase involved in cell wall biosynthesis